ncbi:MAG TPA: aldolase/citrate lyase family protein [Dehalococcoidia bacterium]|nr:aldolase/citrate lyase family protein [Dehalococcoidia bacterium]
MRANRLKGLFAEDRPALGGWLGIPSSSSAEMMAHAGFDWLCVDMQHGSIDYQVALTMLQAISTTDTVPIVRVPWNEPGMIMKSLDAGAYGVIVPMVNSRAEAEAAVAACRYAPDGIRSYGPARAVLYAGMDYFPNANATVMCIPMIETKEALANVDEIVGTRGVDAVFVGPSDLSVSLGLPPSYDQDATVFRDGLASVIAACKKHGVVPGIFGGTPAVAKKRIEQGFRLVQIADDGRTMMLGAAAALAEMRQTGTVATPEA